MTEAYKAQFKAQTAGPLYLDSLIKTSRVEAMLRPFASANAFSFSKAVSERAKEVLILAIANAVIMW